MEQIAYQVSFFDWRYCDMKVSSSPLYPTKNDCKLFIERLEMWQKTMVLCAYTGFVINEIQINNFVDEDADNYLKT